MLHISLYVRIYNIQKHLLFFSINTPRVKNMPQLTKWYLWAHSDMLEGFSSSHPLRIYLFFTSMKTNLSFCKHIHTLLVHTRTNSLLFTYLDTLFISSVHIQLLDHLHPFLARINLQRFIMSTFIYKLSLVHLTINISLMFKVNTLSLSSTHANQSCTFLHMHMHTEWTHMHDGHKVLNQFVCTIS